MSLESNLTANIFSIIKNYIISALWKEIPYLVGVWDFSTWSWGEDLNLQQRAYKARTLPVELPQHKICGVFVALFTTKVSKMQPSATKTKSKKNYLTPCK